MAAPRGVEFDEDILRLVENDFVEIARHEDLDGFGVPVFWKLLGEEVDLQADNSMKNRLLEFGYRF